MSALFQRRIENFVCAHCGAMVVGDGYTNHCPKCLYSQHVDINPGDREETCKGMMAPVAVEGSTGKGYTLIHRCIKCGYERRNKVEKEDSTDVIIALARREKRV